MFISHNVYGLVELNEALKELNKEMHGREERILATSLRNAAKGTVLFAQVAQAARHQDSGRLLRALKVVRHPRPSSWTELYGVGVHKMGKRPKKGEKDIGPDPWYAMIVEYGGKGKRGPLKGFMRASLEENREAFTNLFRKELAPRIERAAKKIGNENARKLAAKVKTEYQ